jgi:hypothetical protein
MMAAGALFLLGCGLTAAGMLWSGLYDIGILVLIVAAIGVAMPAVVLLAHWRGLRHDDAVSLLLARRWSKVMAQPAGGVLPAGAAQVLIDPGQGEASGGQGKRCRSRYLPQRAGERRDQQGRAGEEQQQAQDGTPASRCGQQREASRAEEGAAG